MQQQNDTAVVPRGESMDDKKKKVQDTVPDIYMNGTDGANFFRPHYPVESNEFTETVVPDTDITNGD